MKLGWNTVKGDWRRIGEEECEGGVDKNTLYTCMKFSSNKNDKTRTTKMKCERQLERHGVL